MARVTQPRESLPSPCFRHPQRKDRACIMTRYIPWLGRRTLVYRGWFAGSLCHDPCMRAWHLHCACRSVSCMARSTAGVDITLVKNQTHLSHYRYKHCQEIKAAEFREKARKSFPRCSGIERFETQSYPHYHSRPTVALTLLSPLCFLPPCRLVLQRCHLRLLVSRWRLVGRTESIVCGPRLGSTAGCSVHWQLD